MTLNENPNTQRGWNLFLHVYFSLFLCSIAKVCACTCHILAAGVYMGHRFQSQNLTLIAGHFCHDCLESDLCHTADIGSSEFHGESPLLKVYYSAPLIIHF